MPATSRSLYLRVGALILAGIALSIGFVLFFTAGRIGESGRQFETYIRESVQGLEVGASVRFRGVALGRVTNIGLATAEYPANGPPLDSAYRQVVVRFVVDTARLGATTDIDRAVQAGLRVRLASQGITGVAYLELDFTDPDRAPISPVPWQPSSTIIPAQPSTVAQVTNAAEVLVQKLQAAPIEEILRDAAGLLADLRAQVNDGETARVLRDASGTLQSLRQTVEEAKLAELSNELRATIGDARRLINGPEVRGTLRTANAAMEEAQRGLQRLPAAVAQVEGAARSVRLLVGDAGGDLTPILRDLRAAAGNLRDTTDMLRRSPSGTLLGAPPPAPAWAGERNR